MLEVTRDWLDAFFRSPLQPILARSDCNGAIEILDTRKCAVRRRHRLEGPIRHVYELGDSAPRLDRIRPLLQERFDLQLNTDTFDAILDELRESRLVLEIDDRLISLAIRGEQPTLPTHLDFPGGRIVNHWNGLHPG